MKSSVLSETLEPVRANQGPRITRPAPSRVDEPRLTSLRLARIGRSMEAWSAADILGWATEHYARRITFATGFGAEGCVLIDLIARRRFRVDLFTLDTGLLFPETYELWRNLEQHYGIAIRGIKPAQTVPEQAAVHGPNLWQHNPDRCCELRKITPLKQALDGYDAWVTAIRREQTADRSNALPLEWDSKFGLAKVNPLVRWTKQDVWNYLVENGVPYNPLYDHGYPSIGCFPCTTPASEVEDARAGRWRGHQKNECGLHTERRPFGPEGNAFSA